MTSVVGCMTAALVAITILWMVAGRHFEVTKDPAINLAEYGSRHVTIMAGLSGFAVTGVVLLVTLGRNLPDTSSTPFTTLLVMFLVAYMGFFATSVMFANISGPDPTVEFNVPAGAYAGAATTMYFTIIIGWVALRPLFETFGLTRIADLTGWLLAGAAVGGYGLFAQHLHKSGYASGSVTVLIAALGAVTTVAYALLVGWLGLRTSESTLDLTVAAFIVGSVATAALGALRVLAHSRLTARPLALFGPFLILGYAQGAVVLIGFLLLAVLGLA